jgi:hypothetical protein
MDGVHAALVNMVAQEQRLLSPGNACGRHAAGGDQMFACCMRDVRK